MKNGLPWIWGLRTGTRAWHLTIHFSLILINCVTRVLCFICKHLQKCGIQHFSLSSLRGWTYRSVWCNEIFSVRTRSGRVFYRDFPYCEFNNWAIRAPLIHPPTWQVYLEHRLCVDSLLARVWLQLGLVIMAAVSSLSRLTDNRHHASDVLAGALFGVIIALVTAARLPKYEATESKDQELASGETKKQIRLMGWTIGNSSRYKLDLHQCQAQMTFNSLWVLRCELWAVGLDTLKCPP